MRVMIAQPIEGMTDEQIWESRSKVISQLEAQGHEVWGELSSRVATPKGVNGNLWQLGRALQDLAGADAVYFMDGWTQDKVCRLEYEVFALIGDVGGPRNVFLEEDGRITKEEIGPGVSLGAVDTELLCSLFGIRETDLDKLVDIDPDKFGGGLGPDGYYGHCIRVSLGIHRLRNFMRFYISQLINLSCK